MDKTYMPILFWQLQSEKYIQPSDILQTPDGFRLIYKSLSDILAEKGILDFPDSQGNRHKCSRFYDDWFLYAVPGAHAYAYGLLKLREQEHDAEGGAIADGDTPGVTISFIAFAGEVLLACLANPSDENRRKLDSEINRVVARRGQRHHEDLKTYFINAGAEGPYLVAAAYVKRIASYGVEGQLAVPEPYKEILQRNRTGKPSAKWSRLPHFIKRLNQEAGYVVCDNESIHIKNKDALTEQEAAAILATHTGNTSVYSFAAEVEYHARFLTPWAKIKLPFFGKSIYDSAIRADMTVGDTEFEGPAPFYRVDSKLVKRQYALHKDRLHWIREWVCIKTHR